MKASEALEQSTECQRKNSVALIEDHIERFITYGYEVCHVPVYLSTAKDAVIEHFTKLGYTCEYKSGTLKISWEAKDAS